MQRVALAASLVYRPQLLCSTSRSAISTPICRLRLRDDLRAIIKRTGVTRSTSPHDQAEAVVLGDASA